MGYFNIFYKITRIIDMLTRKRNRKFIIALVLIGAFVFFSPSMTYAQYTNLDSQNLQNIRTKINEIDSTLDTYIPDIYNSVYSMDLDVENIKIRVGGIADNVNTIRTDVTRMAGYLITVRDTLTDVDTEIEDLLDKIDALNLKIDNISDVIVNIESILNSIGDDVVHYGDLNHQDQEEIKELLRDYLYGDKDLYDVTVNSYDMIIPKDFSDSDTATETGTFIRQYSGNYITYYFPIRNGERYYIEWQKVGTYASYGVRYGYSHFVPAPGIQYGTCIRWLATDPNGIDIVSDGTYEYFYITFNQSIAVLTSCKSTYNEGQENGIYGGLTNIQQTTINQETQTRTTIMHEGEETRNTIASTDYNQNVVSVDTSSVDSISSTQVHGLFTTIFNSFNSAATGGVDSIIIPLPHGNSITLYSNVVSSHLGSLSAIISAFWYFVFGLYAFKFVNNLIRSIKTGDILNGFNSSNEVISKDIL